MAATVHQIPQDIVDALEHGDELTDDQFLRLIEAEAAMLGMTFDEARQAARDRRLPKNAIGSDLEFLFRMFEHIDATTE